MIVVYALLCLGAVILVLAARSHRMMNWATTLHAAAALLLSVYLLDTLATPAYFLRSRLFFIDHLGLYEVLITTSIFLLAAIYAAGYVNHLVRAGEMNKRNLKLFYIAFNLLLATVVMAFFSNSLALFWIFTELTTLFSATLIAMLNAKENILAALNYVFIVSSSMLFSFIGLILLFAASRQALGVGTLNWDALRANAQLLSPTIMILSSIFIFIGFAAKSDIVPFHTWLPQAYAKSPSVVAVILSAVLLNIGTCGLIRIYAILRHTAAASAFSTMLIIFGAVSIALAALSMLAERNLKKLFAFSTVENMGVVLLGIGIGTPLALFWILFHILAHAFSKALLFFSAGIVHRQYDSVQTDGVADLFALQPLAAAGLIVGSLAMIGMPALPIFLSKFFLLSQLGARSPTLLLVVLLLLFIVAAAFGIAVVDMVSRTRTRKSLPAPFNAPFSMRLPLIILIVLLFVLGLFFPAVLKTLLTTIVAELGV